MKLFFALLLFQVVSLAHGQVKCSDIYKPAQYRGKLAKLEAEYLESLGKNLSPDTRKFNSKKAIEDDLFERVVKYNFRLRQQVFKKLFRNKKLKGENESLVFDDLDEALNAFLFIDFPDLIKSLHRVSNGSVGIKGLSKTYGRKSFKNFLDTRKYLQQKSPPYTINTFKKIHARYMKGGVDGISRKDLGKYRKDTVYFQLDPSDGITEAKLKSILDENPYLSADNLKASSQGMSGEIYYPSLTTLRDELLPNIKTVNPELASELSSFQKLKAQLEKQEELVRKTKRKADKEKAQEKLDELSLQYDEFVEKELAYNARIAEALTDEAFDWFIRQKNAIGNIDSHDKLRKFTDLVAEYQKKMISIHPFVDGNGRTVREFTVYYAFEKEGLIAPRVIYPDGDIFLSLEAYQELLWEGLVASVRLKDDLVYRLNYDLKFNHSGHIFLPPPSTPIRIDRKTTSSKTRKPSSTYEYMHAGYFRSYVSERMAAEKSLARKLEKDFYATYTQLKEEATEQFKRDHILYTHTKRRTTSPVSIEPISDDFVTWFQRRTYRSKEFYLEKMRRFYDQDTIMWRGIADEENIPTEDEILDHFRKLTLHMASNSVLGKASATQRSIERVALRDFDQYNADIFSSDGSFIRMAKDHSEAGELYDISYGYSTSKDRKVGKAFAMGAMVIADYGQQAKYQHLLASRVLVGQFKSVKDVDLTTLRQVRSKFSYKYGRQQEIMGIGVADPDAVTIVQTIDADGKVMKSYVRDLEDPNVIIVANGDVNPTKPVPSKLIEKKVKLN